MTDVLRTGSDDRAARRERALAALAEQPDGIVEAIAEQAGLASLDILEALPEPGCRLLAGTLFDAVWQELASWGEVLLIVHTRDIVLEAAGTLPRGSEAHGWFNIHGDSPIGGHIRKENCRAIALVDRPFHGRRSCSVWFLNDKGEAMFKVFVRRGADKALNAEQLARFEAMDY